MYISARFIFYLQMNIAQTASKKIKSKAIVDTDSSSDSESGDAVEDDEETKSKRAPRKRGKGKIFTKEGVKGITDNEIRR